MGTTVTVNGSGFAANTYGSVFFDINRSGANEAGEPIQYVTTSPTGAFSTPMIVPSPPTPGPYPILSGFPIGVPAQATASFTVTTTTTTAPSLTLSPASGTTGTTTTVNGSGFMANIYGSVFFDLNRNGTYDTGEPIQYVTTSPTGAFSISMIVPSSTLTQGAYQVLAGFPIGQPAQASASFTLTTVPGTTLRPSDEADIYSQ